MYFESLFAKPHFRYKEVFKGREESGPCSRGLGHIKTFLKTFSCKQLKFSMDEGSVNQCAVGCKGQEGCFLTSKDDHMQEGLLSLCGSPHWGF